MKNWLKFTHGCFHVESRGNIWHERGVVYIDPSSITIVKTVEDAHTGTLIYCGIEEPICVQNSPSDVIAQIQSALP